MIKSWGNRPALELFETGKSRALPPAIWQSDFRKIRLLNRALALEDLRVPPGNRLHALKGGLAGRHAIRINDQYRITFRWENGNAYEVRIEDYH